MQDQRNHAPPDTVGQASGFVRTSTIFYGVMAAIGFYFVKEFHQSFYAAFQVPHDPKEALRLVAIGVVGAGIILVMSYFFEDWFPSYRDLKNVVMHFLGPVSVPTAFYLAALTAFSEELLFRGAIQPGAGLILTSILFGLVHKGHGSAVSTWSLWAFLAGLLLGWMYEETQSLWPPIIAHFCVNAVSILNLRRSYRNWKDHVQELDESQLNQTDHEA